MEGRKTKLVSATTFLSIFVAIAIILSLVSVKKVNGEQLNSGVTIETLDTVQVENLQKLCKVWGFAKYYHPKVISGELDWDFELFKVMPKIAETKSKEEANKILFQWLTGFGEFSEGTYDNKMKIALGANTEWIKNTEYLSSDLSNLLIKMSKTFIADRTNAYASQSPYGFTDFSKENPYPNMQYNDDGYKLLSLFRYWNIIEYYYPYRDIIGEDWEAVLKEFLPKFVDAKDEKEYKLAVLELTSKIHDSHAYTYDSNNVIAQYWGKKSAPADFLIVEGKVVITKIYHSECPLKIGDVVLKIDDKDIFDIIEEKSKYLSFSSDEKIVNNLRGRLFATNHDSLKFTIERKEEILNLDVISYENLDTSTGISKQSHKLLDGNIGYINPGALKPYEIILIMCKFINTDGIIVDLRNYPSDFIVYSLSSVLLSKETVFAKFSFANMTTPGEFTLIQDAKAGLENPDYYKGKVVLLMNECSQSQTEFTAMALRQAPNACIIGSDSIGADGDIVQFSLPGGITTIMTGIGIYNPDGSGTQRVGLKPDISVEPTINGIREGRDELLERAIEFINSGK